MTKTPYIIIDTYKYLTIYDILPEGLLNYTINLFY